MAQPALGQIGWIDLTVAEADAAREFYTAVIGWSASPVSTGDYDDYALLPPGSPSAVAGVCHARGANAGLPSVWLPYFIVADAQRSLDEALARGAQLLRRMQSYGAGRFCVLQDPAGASFALFESGNSENGNA